MIALFTVCFGTIQLSFCKDSSALMTLRIGLVWKLTRSLLQSDQHPHQPNPLRERSADNEKNHLITDFHSSRECATQTTYSGPCLPAHTEVLMTEDKGRKYQPRITYLKPRGTFADAPACLVPVSELCVSQLFLHPGALAPGYNAKIPWYRPHAHSS
jgi:hypothetical protein